MEYILSLWLLIGGQWLDVDVMLPADADCPRTAAAIAADNGASIMAWHCSLEIEI